MADVTDRVEVTLLFGRELKPGDAVLAGGDSDPYVLFSLAGAEEQCSSKRFGTDPDWGEGEMFAFAFPEDVDECALALRVFDRARCHNAALDHNALGVGHVTVCRAKLAMRGEWLVSVPISEGGTIRIRLQLRVCGARGRELCATAIQSALRGKRARRLVAARVQPARLQQALTGSLQERRAAVRNRRQAAEQARQAAEQQTATERDVWAQQAACLGLQRAVRRRLARALVQQRRQEAAVAQQSQGEWQQMLSKQEAAQALLTMAVLTMAILDALQAGGSAGGAVPSHNGPSP